MPTNISTAIDKALLGCSKCGASLPDEAQFCLKCGKPVSSPTKRAAVVFEPAPQILRTSTTRRVFLWSVFTALIALAAWVFVSEDPGAFLGWNHDQSIVDTPFTIGARSFRYYKFSLPEGSVNVAIIGQFTVAGDSQPLNNRKDKSKDAKNKDADTDNSVEVSVLTEPAFTIWQNGYTTSTIYESGKVAQGTVQADIPAGAEIYYLVFSNRLSPKTAKTVHATVLLRYKSWLPEWFRRMKERAWNWLGM